jgi:broad specificity phosphatase PhoE
MRAIEIRRHAYTKKGDGRGRGSHLSEEGVLLARRAGAGLPRFDAVYTSTTPRTLETALAMGFAVADCLEALDCVDRSEEFGHHAWWKFDEPFVGLRGFLARGGPTARLGQLLVQTWTRIAERLPEGGHTLMISHGGVIETGLVAAIPDHDFVGETPFKHCDGVRLTFDGARFRDPKIVRAGGVPDAR